MKKHTILLSMILIFSLFMRIYLIEDIPPGIFVDEIVSAYEAYSIMHTMRDTYGVWMPLLFKATDDYRDSVHIYGMIPFIYVFGLSVLAVRLTTVFYGTLAILFTYLYVEKTFDRKTALISAFLLSISPWNYIFSRISFQAITYPALFLFALYLFHKWLSCPGKKYLVYSAVVFGLSTYTYFPSRIWTPVFILGLFLAYFRRMMERRKELLVPAIVFLIFFSPHIYFLAFSPEKQTSRFDSTSIFNERVKEESIRRMQSLPVLSNMTDSDVAVYSYKFFENYWTHISPGFLFSSGDGNLRHSVKGFGKLHSFELPLIVLGIIICLLRRGGREKFLLWWLVTYPIAVSLTSESLPHSIRAISAMPLFEILSAYALVSLYGFCSSKSRRRYSQIFRKLMLLHLIALLAYGALNTYS
ncbi:MAG: glycosyltransferase family 39 protein, partial [Candidatus Altiarchaeota archaeon]|nr:glycosyltransferase family 39 protein [Candidatus Altiarchaeota archaeon]